MSSSACHTRCWKTVPAGASGRSKTRRRRSKYSFSWVVAAASTGCPSSRDPPRARAAGRSSCPPRCRSKKTAVRAVPSVVSRSSPTGVGRSVQAAVTVPVTAAWTLLPTPVGELLLTTDGTALTAVFFERHRGGHDERPAALARGGSRDDGQPVLAAATTQLKEYFDRRRRVFDL